MNSKSQRFALLAHTCLVRRAQQSTGAELKAYRALAQAFPIVLLQHGFIQGLALLRARDRPEQRDYLHDLVSLLREAGQVDCADAAALQALLAGTNLGHYQHLNRAALVASGWLKQYAKIELKGSEAECHGV